MRTNHTPSRASTRTTPEAPPPQASGFDPERLPPAVRMRLSRGIRPSVLRFITDDSKHLNVAAFGDLFADLVAEDSGILVGRPAKPKEALLEELRAYVAELALAAEGICDIGRQPKIDPVRGLQLQLCESVAKISPLLVALTLVLADLAQDPTLPAAEVERRLWEAWDSSVEAGGPILDPSG